MRTGKRRTEAIAKVERRRLYALDEACALVKEASFVRFDESVDLAVRLGVNPKHADQMVRGATVLPHGIGKVIRVLVFAKGEKAIEAEAAGADFVGADDLVAVRGIAQPGDLRLRSRQLGPERGHPCGGLRPRG